MDHIRTDPRRDASPADRPAGRWAGVIDLMLRRTTPVNDTGLSNLRAYWEALRGDDPVPRRAQVDPRGIERALGIAFLAERVAPEVARFRVAGMRVNGLMGMEVRGMPLSALFEPEARDPFAQALRQVFDSPAIAELSLRGAPGLGQPRLDGRMLLLPLRADDGTVSRVLGGLAMSGKVGSVPRRLAVTGLRMMPLRPDAMHADDSPSPGPEALPAHGISEAPAVFVPAPTPPRHRGRPQLRVISNDD